MPNLTAALMHLHEAYTDAVNRAVAGNRHDLVTELGEEFTDRSLRLMQAPPPPPTAT